MGWDPSAGPRGAFVPGNPGRGELSFLPLPRRDYSALELSVASTGAKLDFSVFYVLSRTEGNYTGLYSTDQHWATPGNNASLQLVEQNVNSTGLLPNDRTHALKVLGAYRLPHNLTLGTFFSVQTGTPLSEFGASGVLVLRPVFLVERGSAGRTPTIWDLNLRLAYDGLKLGRVGGRLLLDVLHVGNPQAVVDVAQTRYVGEDLAGNPIPNPNFGEPTRYQPPMAVRFAVEFGF